MTQDHRKYNINLCDSYLCRERRNVNVRGKINLSDEQTQMAADSLPDLKLSKCNVIA